MYHAAWSQDGAALNAVRHVKYKSTLESAVCGDRFKMPWQAHTTNIFNTIAARFASPPPQQAAAKEADGTSQAENPIIQKARPGPHAWRAAAQQGPAKCWLARCASQETPPSTLLGVCTLAHDGSARRRYANGARHENARGGKHTLVGSCCKFQQARPKPRVLLMRPESSTAVLPQ